MLKTLEKLAPFLVFLAFIAIACIVGTTGCFDRNMPTAPDKTIPTTQASQFNTVFTQATGLGPLFNGESCSTCHPAGHSVGATPLQRFVTRNDNCGAAAGGPIFQDNTTPLFSAATGVYREIGVFGDSLTQGYRSPPDLFGMDFIDTVSDAWILSHADPNDANSDGISGRAHILPGGAIGRFGTKAMIPHLADIVALAFREELGITSPGIGERGLYDQPLPPGTDPVADPEISAADLAATVAEIRAFTLPPSKDEIGDPGGGGGSGGGGNIFTTIGCANCHMGPVHSDLLLHDLGFSGPTEDVCFLNAQPLELRTSPLIGLRFKATRFMHGGNSLYLTDAIFVHDGEASAAKAAFYALSATDRQALLAYVGGL